MLRACYQLFLRSGLAWSWLAIGVLAVDQYTKWWVQHHLVWLTPYPVLPFLNLTLVYNKGAAFSFLHSASGWQNGLLGGLSVVVSIVIVGWLSVLRSNARSESIALNLILAGACGNVLDRLSDGYVIDFLDFHWYAWHFAIFNVADSAICVGTILLIWRWGMTLSPSSS